MEVRARMVLAFLVICLLPTRAAAWKIDTHLWLASKLVDELRNSSCRVDVREFGLRPIDPTVCQAILGNEGAFFQGVLGADVYPDMVAGQFTTHPGVESSIKAIAVARTAMQMTGRTHTAPAAKDLWHTDDWLSHVEQQARTPAEKAFAYGYMMHAAMDMWAHTYVNLYAGDVFSLQDEQEVEFRHMAIESFVKHTHVSFLKHQQRQGATRSAGVTGSMPGIARSSGDNLTNLKAPISFVRETLILNPDVAAQYSVQEATLPVWFMYAYWSGVKDLSATVQPLLTSISSAGKALDTAIANSAPAFTAAQAAYEQAKAVYDGAAKAYDDLSAQARRSTVPNAQLDAARLAMNNAKQVLDEAVRALAPLRLQREMRRALRDAEQQARGFVEGPFHRWRQHLERAVDEYILAWEDTSKELMRPRPKVLTAGSDPAEPLRRWATCWGATFGLPVTNLSTGCSTGLTEYHAVKKELEAWLKNNLITDPTIRKHIQHLEQQMEGLAEALLLQSAKAFSAHFAADNGAVAGFARSIVNLRGKETPDPATLNDEFDDNTAPLKRLVIYPGSKMSELIYKDMGLDPQGQNHELDLPALSGFAALQNSLTMSKLVLMGGPQLNALIADSLGRTTTALPRGGGTALPGSPLAGLPRQLYPASAAPGAVLIGAIRNIDGDHQWQRFAPALPPGRDLPTLTDDNAARLSSRIPAGSSRTLPRLGSCRRFGYDENDPGKTGLLLWQNEPVRRALFNRIFLAPLVPGMIGEKEALGVVPLSAGIEPAAGDAFPPSRPHPDCVAK